MIFEPWLFELPHFPQESFRKFLIYVEKPVRLRALQYDREIIGTNEKSDPMESRRQLQFHIKTVLAVTIVVAILMALRAWFFFAFATALVFAHLGAFLGPVAIIAASIVSGRQVENRIDIRDNLLVGCLLKAWLVCIALVLTLWASLFLLLPI